MKVRQKSGKKDRSKIGLKSNNKKGRNLRSRVKSNVQNALDNNNEENLKKSVLKLLGDETVESAELTDDTVEYFQDMDLAVLGSPPDQYAQYVKLLQQEYSSNGLPAYRNMRLKLFDTSLRPLCTSTPNINIASRNRSKKRSGNRSLRQQALRGVNGNKIFTNSQNTQNLNGSKTRKPKKRKLFTPSTENDKPEQPKPSTSKPPQVSPVSDAVESDASETEPLPKIDSPASSSEDTESEVIPRSPVITKVLQEKDVHDSSSDSDCCVVEDSRSKTKYTPLVRRKPKSSTYIAPGQIIDLDSDSDTSLEDSEIAANSTNLIEKENFDQLMQTQESDNILFFEDKNGSYALMTPLYKKTMAEDVTLVRSPSIVCLEDNIDGCVSTKPVASSSNAASTSAAVSLERNAVEPQKKKFKKFQKPLEDDSIVFLGEIKIKKPPFTGPTPDFIRLEAEPAPKKRKKSTNFYSARREVRDAVGNSRKPNEKEKSWINPAAMMSEKRLVVIDGNNVCHLKTATGFFSVKRLQTTLKYFESKGHQVKVVVPEYRLNRFKSSDYDVMQQLFDDGKIVKTPCKRFKDKKTESIYDDRVMLQIAAEFDGVVISGDNFRDLVGEDKVRDKIIEERVISPIWVSDDMIIMPEDPYGRFGPKLKEILHRIKPIKETK